MRALKFLTVGAMLACAAYLLADSAIAKPEPKGEKATKTTKLRKNKYAKEMVNHYYDDLKMTQYKKFSMLRIPVADMEALLKQAKSVNSKYIVVMNGAHTASSVKYFAAAGDDGTVVATKDGMATADGDATLTLDRDYSDVMPDDPQPVVCYQYPDGTQECYTVGKVCPPPASCDRDSVYYR